MVKTIINNCLNKNNNIHVFSSLYHDRNQVYMNYKVNLNAGTASGSTSADKKD